jgi:lipopolysaccharide transport system ATP-binding protein
MSDAIISVENLGKKYAIRHQAQRGGYKTLRETLVQKTASLFSRQDRQAAQASTREDFWALKDVSFDLERGKVLGIIGRNGAGKSTLLKILSRITEPSEGRVTLRGRVASLLEVGTGFHPELTGRENIFLNGSILGMSRFEIRRMFDEIVAFAGVEKFLDTPVKRYSSGMYVRLAFAVAAHLEPEILVVDEVLAVGDTEFQKKCLGKMQEVSRGEGRTVLFVSHNMGMIQSLCSAAVVLEKGTVRYVGSVEKAVSRYLDACKSTTAAQFQADAARPTITFVEIDRDELTRSNLVIDIGFKSPFPLKPVIPGIVVSSLLGTPVYHSNPRFHPGRYGPPHSAEGVLRMVANDVPIHGGTYQLSVWLSDWTADYDIKRDVLSFEFGTGHPPANMPPAEVCGFIDRVARWQLLAGKPEENQGPVCGTETNDV